MRTVQQQIKSATTRKFIRPLNDGIKYNINKLSICNQISHRETINLLTQSRDTLNTIENAYIFNKDNNEHIEVKMITSPSIDTIWSVLNEDLDMIIDLIIKKSKNLTHF